MKQKDIPVVHGPFMDTYDYKALIEQSANTPLEEKVYRENQPKPKQKRIQRMNKPRGSVRGK
jgi:hypothetical protein